MTNRLKKLFKKEIILLTALLLGGLIVRFLLLPLRWINPDEGAHLMDARFLIQGLMPIVEYGSRQPFYVFMIAAFLKLFGITLTAGRLLPLFSSIGVAVMLYFIGKKLFNPQVGLIACGIYLFLPFIVIWSTTVKTEQPAIFFVCLSVYFLFQFSTKVEKRGWIVLSGITAALAFYVRQPTLYLPLAFITYLLFFVNKKPLDKLYLVANFLLGYLAVVASFFAIFLNKMTFQHILFSQLNPLYLVWNRLLHSFNLLPAQYQVVDSGTFRILDQDLAYTMRSWEHALFFSLFIIIGSILFFVAKKNKSKINHNKSFFLVLWAGFVLLVYLFQSANRGFFSQYFIEALPPLILLAAAFVYKIYENKKIKTAGTLVVFFLLFVIMAVHKVYWQLYPGVLISFLGFFVLLAILFVFFLSKENQFKKKSAAFALLVIPSLGLYFLLVLLNLAEIFSVAAAFVVLFFILLKVFPKLFTDYLSTASLFLLLLSLFVTAAFSGSLLGPGYEAVWSQKSLKEVKDILIQEGGPASTVLSGGMVWTYESGLAPFLNVTHPTEFYKKKYADFDKLFQMDRPTFIILDKYTSIKFSKYWEFITQEINQNYQLLAEIPTGSFNVKVFKVVHPSRGMEPAFAVLD